MSNSKWKYLFKAMRCKTYRDRKISLPSTTISHKRFKSKRWLHYHVIFLQYHVNNSHLADDIRKHIDWTLIINFSFELLKLTDAFDSTLVKIECTGISIEVKQEKSVISVLPLCGTIEACLGWCQLHSQGHSMSNVMSKSNVYNITVTQMVCLELLSFSLHYLDCNTYCSLKSTIKADRHTARHDWK